MASKFVLDQRATQLYLTRERTLLVARTARQVEEAAKREVPVRKPNENNRAGGRTRASIGTRLTVRVHTTTAKVGSRVKNAEPTHQGAKRHIILPKRKQFLSFKWNKAERYAIPLTRRGKVQLKSVKHPGMKGKQYLTDPLRRYGRAAGFRVTYVRKVR